MRFGGRHWVWVQRALWSSLPFTAAGVFDDALAGRSDPVQVTAAVGLWMLWGLGLAAALIPHPVTLTVVRLLHPAALVAAIWATLAEGPSTEAIVALTVTAAVAVVTLSAPVGAEYVNGAAYGDERRLPLRPPGFLLLGPLPAAWLVPVATTFCTPMLLAAGQWVLGTTIALVGGAASVVAVRALHGLSRRWVVFVPAGLVLHDRLALVDPVLFRRRIITRLGPALADTRATDTTMGALGPALELALGDEVEISRRPPRGAKPTITPVDRLLFMPSQPGVVLAEAERRRIKVATT